MNHLSKILVSCFIIISVNCIYSQIKDSTKIQKTEFLNKGRFAIVFELGTLIDRSTFFEGYNFLVKYHIGDNSALRVNFKIGEGILSNPELGSSTIQEYSSYNYEVNLNYQYYFSKKTFVKPFISLGPTYIKDYYYELWDENNFRWNNEWGIGVTLTIGTEIFLFDNISLVGEYLIKGIYDDYRYEDFYNGEFRSFRKEISRKLTANTARLGFSVYF
jgi:hypothetical protein